MYKHERSAWSGVWKEYLERAEFLFDERLQTSEPLQTALLTAEGLVGPRVPVRVLRACEIAAKHLCLSHNTRVAAVHILF